MHGSKVPTGQYGRESRFQSELEKVNNQPSRADQHESPLRYASDIDKTRNLDLNSPNTHSSYGGQTGPKNGLTAGQLERSEPLSGLYKPKRDEMFTSPSYLQGT